MLFLDKAENEGVIRWNFKRKIRKVEAEGILKILQMNLFDALLQIIFWSFSISKIPVSVIETSPSQPRNKSSKKNPST